MRVHDVHLGVRFDDEEALRRAERAYGDRAVEDVSAVDDLSLSLHPPVAEGVARRRPSLRHGGCDLVRSGSADRLLRALDSFLAAIEGPAAGLVRIDGTGALVAGDRASLVPTALLDRSSAIERRVVEAGAAMADGPSVLIDPARREVVVRPGLARDASLGITSELLVPPGRYALHRIHWSSSEVAETDSAALGLVRLLNRLERAGPPLDEGTFQHVVALADQFSPISVGERGLRDLEAIVSDLTG